MWREEAIDLKITRFFESSARVLLSLLILVIMLAILAGIGCTGYDLRLVLGGDFHAAFKSILVDMLTVLALVEVKVTYIIDTVIVTVLTEVMAFWYRDMDWQGLAMVIALVLSLACIRIIAVRFSPRRLQHDF
jgi:hypothetical protein